MQSPDTCGGNFREVKKIQGLGQFLMKCFCVSNLVQIWKTCLELLVDFKREKKRQWATKLSQIILLMELLPALAAHVITGASETLAITSWPAPNEVQSFLSHNRLSDCFLLSLESFFQTCFFTAHFHKEILSRRLIEIFQVYILSLVILSPETISE